VTAGVVDGLETVEVAEQQHAFAARCLGFVAGIGKACPIQEPRQRVVGGNVGQLLGSSLGGLFVAGQIYEFTTFYREGLGFTTSLFSSSFFTLTGFHGVHVSIGIIMLVATIGMIQKEKISGDKAEAVEMVGLYWHFVDIVWIFIFTVIYLIPPA